MLVKLFILIGSAAIASAGPNLNQVLQSAQIPLARGFLDGNITLVKQGLDLAEEIVEYGYGVVSNGSASATYITRVGLGNTANFILGVAYGGARVVIDALELLKAASRQYAPAYSNFVALGSSRISALLYNIINLIQRLTNIANKFDWYVATGNDKVQRYASNIRMAAENGINAGKASAYAVDKVQGVKNIGKKVFGNIFGWFHDNRKQETSSADSEEGIGKKIFHHMTDSLINWMRDGQPAEGGRSFQNPVAVRPPNDNIGGTKIPGVIRYSKVEGGLSASGSTGAEPSTTDAPRSTTYAAIAAAARKGTEKLANADGTEAAPVVEMRTDHSKKP